MLGILARYKAALIASAVISAILGFAATSLMSRAYRAEAVVSPLNDTGRSDLMAALGGQFGGLGALAGLGIGGDSARNERIATLMSRDLAVKFIDRYGLVPLFCGAELVKCRNGAAHSAKSLDPERNDALKLFLRRVLTVNEDKRTGLVRVSVTWPDRVLAARWANDYVAMANSELLANSIAESDRRIQFLRTAAEHAETVELRQAVYSLMESEIKSRMVASSRVDYAFKVVDPALAPDERDFVRPQRALLAIVAGMTGAGISLALLFLLARRKVGRERAKALRQ